jgi:uncharacterized protein
LTGTILNIAAVLIGGTIGIVFGSRFPEKMRKTVIAVLGLFTLALGIQLFIQSQNPILVLGSLLIGAVLGELIQIEELLSKLGRNLETRFFQSVNPYQTQSTFVKGFLTASLVFCVGPMTILGSIQDGLSGDYSLLAIKSVLDGFAALAFASTLGVGVLFSVIIILIYQGGLTLLAVEMQSVFSPGMTTEMTAVGGILLVGIAISSLLEIKTIRVGNLLPGLVIAPMLVFFLESVGIGY